MRNAFADEITKIAQKDERVVLLSGDIGNRLFDPYKAACPDRFFNCGVAEANMISLGAGMAMNGKIPIAYTIASFLIYRAYEQIRVDMAYHNLPIVLVGVGGGLSYASNGSTHHTLEDIAIMRALPNMQVMCTADAFEVRAALNAAINSQKPTYIRIGKKNEPCIYDSIPKDFRIGKAIKVIEGSKVALIGTGNILPNAVSATELLKKDGVSASVYNFHTIKPLDQSSVKEIFHKYENIISIEEHGRIGGLGSAILETCNDLNINSKKLKIIGTPDQYLSYTGEQKHAREIVGLHHEGIYKQIKEFLL